MVFGLTKKERRVPDLSRYDYHYQNNQDYNKSSQLSADAAYMASGYHDVDEYPEEEDVQGYYEPQNACHVSRTRSLVSSPQYTINTARRPSHSSSMLRTAKKCGNPSGRSYSLRSQNSVDTPATYNRMGSMVSNTNLRRTPVSKSKNQNNSGNSNGNNSRTNSITVQTTEVKDPSGKTKSMTRKTIKRVNGYEYVETTTTTTTTTKNNLPMNEIHRQFDQFSGNFMQEEGISEIMEEDENFSFNNDTVSEKMKKNPNRNQYGLSGNKIEEGDHEKHVHGYRALLTETSPSLSHESELVPLDDTSSISKFSDARDESPVAIQRSPLSSNKKTKSQKKKTVRNSQALDDNSIKSKTSRFETKHKSTNSTTRSTQMIKKELPRQLTEEEMYAKAYEIAKMKVYQTEIPGNFPSSKLNRVTQESAKSSNMGKRMSLRQPSNNALNERRAVSVNQPTYNTSRTSSLMKSNPPSASGQQSNNIVKNNKGLGIRPHAMSDEEMYAKALEIAQKKYNDQQMMTNSLPLKTPTKSNPKFIAPLIASPLRRDQTQFDKDFISPDIAVPANNIPQPITESPQRFLRLRKLSSVGNNNKNLDQLSKVSSSNTSPHKSKFKNVFDKVIQFSQENSGYQPSKKELQQLEQENEFLQPQQITQVEQQEFQEQGEPLQFIKNETEADGHVYMTTIPPTIVSDGSATQTNSLPIFEATFEPCLEYEEPVPITSEHGSISKKSSRRRSTLESVTRHSFKSSLRTSGVDFEKPVTNQREIPSQPNEITNNIHAKDSHKIVKSHIRHHSTVTKVGDPLDEVASQQQPNKGTTKSKSDSKDKKTIKKKSIFSKLFKR